MIIQYLAKLVLWWRKTRSSTRQVEVVTLYAFHAI